MALLSLWLGDFKYEIMKNYDFLMIRYDLVYLLIVVIWKCLLVYTLFYK